MPKIAEEQFILATMGISLSESENLVDFEREAYVNMAIKEKKMQLDIATMMAGGHLSRLS